MSSNETPTYGPERTITRINEKIEEAVNRLLLGNEVPVLPNPRENERVFNAFLEAACLSPIEIVEQATVEGQLNQEKHQVLLQEAKELLDICDHIEFHFGYGEMQRNGSRQNVIGSILSLGDRRICVGVGIDGFGQLHPYISREMTFGLANKMTFPGEWDFFTWFKTRISPQEAPESMIQAMQELVTPREESLVPHNPRDWLQLFAFRREYTNDWFKRCKLAGEWPRDEQDWILGRLETQLYTTRRVGHPAMEARLLGFHVGRLQRYIDNKRSGGDETNIIFWERLLKALDPEIVRIEEGQFREEYIRARENEDYGIWEDHVPDDTGLISPRKSTTAHLIREGLEELTHRRDAQPQEDPSLS